MADFDPTKPVQTRDGRSARILCTDRESNGAGNIVALVRIGKGAERIHTYYAAGHIWEDGRKRHSDLVNIPERSSTFYNTYCDGGGTRWYATPEEARAGLAAYERWASAANAPNAYLGTIEIVNEGGGIVERKFHNLLENENG